MSSRQLCILGWCSEESSGLDIQVSVYMSSATMMVKLWMWMELLKERTALEKKGA